jgi:8-oxo-dGTP pyrophosphatase MutT (NUDIX family)
MTSPTPARPAATVVVLRPVGVGFEVLLVRRNDRVAFMAGAFVFPGGRVDEGDHVAAANEAPLEGSPRFTDLSQEAELACRRAAVRELQEEAAVTVPLDALIPIAHWVTPSNESRRFDTRFYLTVMPPGQQAQHDQGEMTELAWCRPSDAIARCRNGEIMLPPPTWTTLRRLERHATLDDALEWARATPIVRIEPHLLTDGTRRILTLPGDPTFATVAGWVVPNETRFEIQEGRGWLPMRP